MASKQILSPLPGTFYRRPSPDEPGLVEVMKSFHEVKSEVAGTVSNFLAENEDAVMAGQPLVDLED
jgi:biotin carboxyl carrier protein